MRSVSAAALFVLAGCAGAAARSDDHAPAAPTVPHPLEGYWDLRMERTLWWPRLVPGSLAVWRGPHGLRGSVTFDSMWNFEPRPIAFDTVEGDRVRFWVEMTPTDRVPLDVVVRDGTFSGEVRWESEYGPDVSAVRAERVRETRRIDVGAACDAFPREDDPEKLGVDPTALDRLITYAGRTETDALVVVKDGRLVCDRRFLRPTGLCQIRSITKVVATLAIPLLMEEGKLPRDLDTPLATWFPDWKTDERKARITLRHVLTHTSGLASDGVKAMQSSADELAFALASAAKDEPGRKFAENHQAMELLSGIVAKAAGEQIDTYLAARVFEPLGIADWRWHRDAAGNAATYAGISIGAEELARIGRLVAKRGKWGERQIVPAWWFDEIAKPSAVDEEVGLAWRLLRRAEDERVVQTEARIERLREAGWAGADLLKPLVGKTFSGRRAWWDAVIALLGGDADQAKSLGIPWPGVGGEIQGPVSCVYGRGETGRCWLLVIPDSDLVVVRLYRGVSEDELSADAQQRLWFFDVLKLTLDLVPR